MIDDDYDSIRDQIRVADGTSASRAVEDLCQEVLDSRASSDSPQDVRDTITATLDGLISTAMLTVSNLNRLEF